jgi:hypothetical protein
MLPPDSARAESRNDSMIWRGNAKRWPRASGKMTVSHDWDPLAIRGYGEQPVADRGNTGTPGEAAKQLGLLTKRGDAFHSLSPERDLASATLQKREGDFGTLPCGDPTLTQTRPKESRITFGGAVATTLIWRVPCTSGYKTRNLSATSQPSQSLTGESSCDHLRLPLVAASGRIS